ncbi:pyrroline-5-carboxylate reductase [Pseudosulfitobacter pseudonitzschiae]|uniref:Pyrroline-5-carboxylate reductase n=1 Tax=Pseudosulfitobacter pseudonitzschiae TaxID=1402135 RepID=A0A073J3W1_9RHOB|nr:pyrroline-5-carboxylate reductase dimerization domain-containing protein [Pseudosulfitobacter pseudonitzschiae]KEJ97303.1 pyrroline-5-carboxylate reductase [Pseudosulfitobacter pseudonitzschiae]QKS10285.1 NAD(P)-binding domain-containing protein [Pseudosulfitobacter pseudonitzschiae]SHF56730.1 pyrroline-5-carboxylate reductase [Pseudosulfitobacter pseudonitzschiae]
MGSTTPVIGIVGGSGMLGSAIATAILRDGAIAPECFWISNQSGKVPDLGQGADIHVTSNNQDLVDACDGIILCVPPARFPDLKINASGKLVISVMAGVIIDRIAAQTGASRVIRAMSSPAAALALAYSPWCANPAVTDEDRKTVELVLRACGKTDEVFDESHIDHFTAITGPVPGFVALFAQCMADYAESQGIDANVADRAVRQLFLAGGTMLAERPERPADHVRGMIDYAGTTAAGLTAMIDADLHSTISDGLLAAANKAKSL